MDFIRKLYEKRLENQIDSKRVPSHIMIVADEMDFLENISKFRSFINWCKELGIMEISICVHMLHPVSSKLLDKIALKLKDDVYNLRIFTEDDQGTHLRNGQDYDAQPPQNEGFTVNLIAGYGGRAEITDAVKELAHLVEKNEMEPEDIEEKDIERFLSIKESPDLIMRAGEEIPDFLIWQSIYSELHFLDIDWKSFRYVDFLRYIRDYQQRERRYGE
ncbi:MAG: undecaprenyl diphosphate synthase family protein [Archaeoglobaceae archaeon]